MIDTRRIVEAVKIPLLFGVILLIAMYAILLGLLFSSQGMDQTSQEIIGYVSTFLPYILFFPLFLWTGYRTARKYGSELLEAGLVTAILAALIKIIEFVVGLFVGLIVILILSGGLSGGMMGGEMGDIGAFFGMMMFGGVMIGALICAIQLASTIPVNFLVGLIGAYIAGARKLVEQEKEVKKPEKKPEKTVAKKPRKRR